MSREHKLRGAGKFSGVSVSDNMIDTRPMITFLSHWDRGPADKQATKFKAALGELGK